MAGFRNIASPALTAFALASAACGSSGAESRVGTGAVVPCNALELPPRVIGLAEILAAGRDSASTVYVVDRELEHGLRLFTSEGTTLRRHPVAGSGQGTDALGEFFTISTTALDLRIKVSILASGERRMGVLRGEPAVRDFVIGQQGEELVLVPDDTIRALPVSDLANGVVIEYFFALEDGRNLLVSRPEQDYGYEDFRVFFGSHARLIEREVLRIERQRDGGTTEISFDHDGAAALAYFPAPMRNEPSWLSVGGSDWALTPIDHGLPATVEFLCLAAN